MGMIGCAFVSKATYIAPWLSHVAVVLRFSVDEKGGVARRTGFLARRHNLTPNRARRGLWTKTPQGNCIELANPVRVSAQCGGEGKADLWTYA